MSEADPRPTPPEDRVGDDERLYRSVREKLFIRHSETEVTVSEHAYNDPAKQPSVDRARIIGSDPQRSRFRDGDAIVSLIAGQVRAIESIVQYSATGKPNEPYRFDVIPRPIKDHPDPNIPDNPAHAQIEADREISGSAFERLKRVLAFMSGSSVELDPYEQVVYFTRTKKIYHKRTCHYLKNGQRPVAFQKVPTAARPCSQCKPEGWGSEPSPGGSDG
jgi:hypothetical protein